MIEYRKGNILESEAQALVNTVNLVGVMGKGVALQFKTAFPDNYKRYKEACASGNIAIGKLFVTEELRTTGKIYIINFPTKTDWRKPSEYHFISAGLDDLLRIIDEKKIKSIALPPLGAGNGGLNWGRVKMLIEEKLGQTDIDVIVYEPNVEIVERMKDERAHLTDGRALLLYVLFDLVRNGELVSEFSSEKVCYFLQKFGAGDIFNLKFNPKYYGPYSGKVRYILYALNGSYIMGYSAMDKRPFDALMLVPECFEEVRSIVENNSRLCSIATRTMKFLNGFYSDYGLELLSSIDMIMESDPSILVEDIYQHLQGWSIRKGSTFTNRNHINTARLHILDSLYS